MKTISLTDEAYEHLENDVWETVTNGPLEGDWWNDYYQIPNKNDNPAFVVFWQGDDMDKAKRKTLTKRKLVEAYLSMKNPTHCGGYHIIYDPDSCSADKILQQALFGELRYG